MVTGIGGFIGGALLGGGDLGGGSESTRTLAPLTEEELKLLRIGADIAEEQLAALRRQGAFQEEEFAAIGPQFNEAAYLRQNPDVAKAVAAGQFSSGLEHFQRFGQAEGRSSPLRPFDPGASLRNQQIALLQEQVEPIRAVQDLGRAEATRATGLSGDLAALRERNLAFLNQPEGFLSRSLGTGPSSLGLSGPSPNPRSINRTGGLPPSIPNILGQPSGFLPPPNGTGAAGLGLAGGVGTQENPARPTLDGQVQAMPPGTFFIDENGQLRRKP